MAKNNEHDQLADSYLLILAFHGPGTAAAFFHGLDTKQKRAVERRVYPILDKLVGLTKKRLTTLTVFEQNLH